MTVPRAFGWLVLAMIVTVALALGYEFTNYYTDRPGRIEYASVRFLVHIIWMLTSIAMVFGVLATLVTAANFIQVCVERISAGLKH